MIKTLLAILNYAVASGLFYSGIAGKKRSFHEFTMKRLQTAADQGSQQALLLMAKLLRYRGVSPLNKIAGVSYLESLRAKLEALALSQNSKTSRQAQGDVYGEVCFLLAEAYTDHNVVLASPADDSHSNKPATSPSELYRLAAELGHKMAALRLSKAYENGSYGLEKDSLKADHWKERFLNGVDFE